MFASANAEAINQFVPAVPANNHGSAAAATTAAAPTQTASGNLNSMQASLAHTLEVTVPDMSTESPTHPTGYGANFALWAVDGEPPTVAQTTTAGRLWLGSIISSSHAAG